MMRHSFCIILLLLASKTVAQPENTMLPGGILFDGEPSLAVNPTNPKNIVVAWMSEILTDLEIGIRTSMSTDGGHTWSPSSILPHLGTRWHSADVSMVFAKNGTAYLSYIDYREAPDSGGVFVVHSSDGGKSWSTPIKAIDANDVVGKSALDRPWIAIDNSGTASDGTLYITTKPAPWILPSKNAPNEPYFKRSTDHGSTWSAVAPLDGDPYPTGYLIAAPMASPQVTANGSFVAAYPSYELLQPARHILARSYDRGVTFERHIIAEKYKSGIQNDTLSKLGYCLVADPNDSNRLALILPNDSLGDWDAFAITSSDGGRTWGHPVRINDDAPGNGVWQDLVWGAYAPNGDLVAAWRDRRNGSGAGYQQPSDVYFAVSTDNGQTFGKNLKLSSITAEYDTVLSLNGNDFLSCTVAEDSICTAWGDTRTGRLKIYFAKAALADGIASVTELPSDEQGLIVVPTVVAQFFLCMLPVQAPARFSLTDMSGHSFEIGARPFANGQWQCQLPQDLPNGMYILSADCQGQRFRSKFVVTH